MWLKYTKSEAVSLMQIDSSRFRQVSFDRRRKVVPLVRNLIISLLFISAQTHADSYLDLVNSLGLQELVAISDESVLGRYGTSLPGDERRAAAVLVDLGVIYAHDLAQPRVARSKIVDFAAVVVEQHPDLVGRIGDPSVFVHLEKPLDHETLLKDDDFVKALHQSLADGVLTGYDLRRVGVYDGFPRGRFFVYSHSSPEHVQQLVTLLHRERIGGWVYLVPKVSAFLFRDDWGTPGENVVALPDGRLVVQGRELAVLFRFDQASDRKRFHDLVTRYAKKDEVGEPGLIASSWWQPFYYTDSNLEGFEPISLVILSKGDYEATLTVREERTEAVVQALEGGSWDLRVEQVWVNPPFFRFLNGGSR